MATAQPTPHERLMDHVFSLSVACPYHGGNPTTCQLCEIRKLSLKERHQWTRSIPDEEITRIIDIHERCLESLQHG